MLYTALYMAARRTQIYLTAEQRKRLDERRRRERRTLAEIVRQAVDAYLADRSVDPATALNGTVSELLVDTDVFVDHLRGARRMAPGSERILYSVVTRCELFAGLKTDEDAVRRLLDPSEEIHVDRPIAERDERIRLAGDLRTPDALKEATAHEHELVLVTRNTRDFRPAHSLKI